MPQGKGIAPTYTMTVELTRWGAHNDLYILIYEQHGRSQRYVTYEDVIRRYRVKSDLPITAGNIGELVRQALVENSGAGAVQVAGGDAS